MRPCKQLLINRRVIWIIAAVAADFSAVQPHSPHGVEVVIRGNVVLVITGQAELIAVALMDKVPQLFGAQRLR